MQFADILPFLDAEIDRLQKARDLLAYIPTSDGIDPVEERMSLIAIATVPQTTQKTATTRNPAATAVNVAGMQQEVKPVQGNQSGQPEQIDRSTRSTRTAQISRIDTQAAAASDKEPSPHDIEPPAPHIERMPYKPRRERRSAPGRTRHTPGQSADTALRSSVPAGPVVVSAEEVRKVQAIRVEAARTAPVAVEPGQFYGWRDRASELRSAEALLQRWISRAAAE